MSDMARDVDEALKEEKYKELWRKYGSFLVTAAVALIVLTAIISGFRAYKLGVNEKATTTLSQAISGNGDDITALVAAVEDLPATHKSLGLIEAAKRHAIKGESDQALKLYKDVFENRKTPNSTRDLARILYVGLVLDGENTEKLDLDALTKIIKPTVKNEDSAFYGQAVFLNGFIKGSYEQDFAGALKELQKIATNSALPSSLVSRTLALRELYVHKLAAANKEK